VPASALGRPRVDVVLAVTGAYRDNLPGVMRFLQDAVNQIAALDEPGNPVFENARALQQQLQAQGVDARTAMLQARVRIFGPESGQYGSGLAETAGASGAWERESQLSDHFLDRMATAFGNEPETRNVRPTGMNLLRENLKDAQVALMSRSVNNFGLLSSQEPFEYLGGLSLAIREAGGKAPQLMIADLRDTKSFANETVAGFLGKELRTRMFHPNWIREMMEEGYNGATEFADSLDNFWGWNVTDRSVVREDQWEQFHAIYVEDSLGLGMREFFEQKHPAALAQISQRMLEAVRKGYWDASPETVRELVETWRSLTSRFDIQTRNEAFKEYVAEAVKRFGLDAPAVTPADIVPETATAPEAPATQETPTEPASEAPEAALQAVTGTLMKQVQPPTAQARPPLPAWLLLLLALVLAGALHRAWQQHHFPRPPAFGA
jgi:cobaltochelatase CobN